MPRFSPPSWLRIAIPPSNSVVLTLVGSAALWVAWQVMHRTVRVDDVISRGVEPTLDMRVDVNAAPAAELSLLPGVGVRLAQRIVEHRDQHGPFQSLEDLMRVPGIGPVIVDRARPYAVVLPPP